ncbi:MAG: carboxymuconolactone decarboxylase family protein [Gemmatimonadales bacterium]
MARRHGASEALLAAIQGQGGGDEIERLEAGWQAALAYADVVHRSGHEVADALFERLAAAWDPGQIAELTMVIGLAEYFNRFNDALRVEPTK